MTKFYISAITKDGYVFVPKEVMQYIKEKKLKYVHEKKGRLIFSPNKESADDCWSSIQN